MDVSRIQPTTTTPMQTADPAMPSENMATRQSRSPPGSQPREWDWAEATSIGRWQRKTGSIPFVILVLRRHKSGGARSSVQEPKLGWRRARMAGIPWRRARPSILEWTYPRGGITLKRQQKSLPENSRKKPDGFPCEEKRTSGLQ